MDAKDHARITHHSGQESHGVLLCHKCGWPFPNPHPSAEHRRAHRRVCGTVEGYKLVHSEGSTHSAVSDDDEHPSDDDHKTLSPKIVESSKNGIGTGGIGERSNRMEDTIQSPGSSTDSSIMQIPGVPKSTNDCLESAVMSQDHVPSSSLGSVAPAISEDLTKESTLGLRGDGGVHVDVDCKTPDDPLQPKLVGGVTTRSRKRISNSSIDRRGKKESRLSQMGDALKAWVEASKVRAETYRARTEVLLARTERYKSGTSSEATSIGNNDFNITKCMATLQAIDLLDNDTYLKAVEKFTSPEWREIFINMPDERKKAWLDRL